MTDNEVDELVAELRATFFPHPAASLIAAELDRIVRRRLADHASDRAGEAGGLVVLGPSGSGKSYAIRHAIDTHALLNRARTDGCASAAFVRVPAPSSIKDLGAATLDALGWNIDINSRWSAMERWRRVQGLLEDLQVFVLHFDEAQHLAGGHPKELQGIGDAFKTRLQHPVWPVALVISATPEFKLVLNQDQQLARRITPIVIERLSPVSHAGQILTALRRYVDQAGIGASDSIKEREFTFRLIAAGDRYFALICNIIVDAIGEALEAKCDTLDNSHFAEAFRSRSGSTDGFNPFLARNYQDIDVRRLLEGRDLEEDP